MMRMPTLTCAQEEAAIKVVHSYDVIEWSYRDQRSLEALTRKMRIALDKDKT